MFLQRNKYSNYYIYIHNITYILGIHLFTFLQYSKYSLPYNLYNHFSSVYFINIVRNNQYINININKYILLFINIHPILTNKNAEYIGFLTLEYIPVVTKLLFFILSCILDILTLLIHKYIPSIILNIPNIINIIFIFFKDKLGIILNLDNIIPINVVKHIIEQYIGPTPNKGKCFLFVTL